MKTPPLLLGATLAFWGWQSGFFIIGAILGVALESTRFIKARWEFSDEDFNRIWTLCSVLFLSAAVYAFTANEGPAHFGHMLQDPTTANQSSAGIAGAQTAIALFRWLPMIFFLFVAAQAFSSRQDIPWSTISQISRWRWKQAKKLGLRVSHAGGMNVAFPYFGVCLFSASTHGGEGSRYFWGLTLLLAWALWSQRSLRFGNLVWFATLALAISLGFAGQKGVGKLQNYVSNLNPEWFSRLGRHATDPAQSLTSIGQIGRLKLSGSIVIRLQPRIGPAPTYLREASYRIFGRSRFWSASDYKDKLMDVTPETNGSTFLLLHDKPKADKVQIACYLEGRSGESGEPTGLLPLPTGCSRLDGLPAFAVSVRTKDTGAVLAEGPGLLMFDASYGPGPTIDAPPDTNVLDFRAPVAEDLNVPESERPALDRILPELKLGEGGRDRTLQAINAFFQNHFTYSTWLSSPKGRDTNGTPISRFLLQTRRGHCEYFATATVLLLRELNIPARYAVGYAVHEPSGTGYVVRQRDAHAWCLVWNDRTKAWEDFDTTPASWVDEEAKQASAWQRISDYASWIRFQIARFRWGQTHLRRYLLLALTPVLLLLLYQIGFRHKRKRLRPATTVPEPSPMWPGRDSEFYLVEKQLSDRGAPRSPDEPLTVWLRRATANPALADVDAPLQNLLSLHYRYRFDPQSLSPSDRDQLRRGAAQVLEAITRTGS